jgi:energy-coupling factor transporter transmembrane protein EcfT
MNKILTYLSLPEMIVFWIILVVVLFLIGIIFYFVVSPWNLIGLIVGIILLIITFVFCLKNAIKYYQVLSERDQ